MYPSQQGQPGQPMIPQYGALGGIPQPQPAAQGMPPAVMAQPPVPVMIPPNGRGTTFYVKIDITCILFAFKKYKMHLYCINV